ncbi:MAG TPA: hypothetical protein VHD31_03725 [Candidatus Paceibacterota bacterium]|nr:hypothetical protein [Candidatus Paceibacterota bacterium]
MLNTIKTHWLSFLLIALALLAQVFLITRSFSFLLTNVLPDDAFYYFQIAHNIALGLGSTFDGVNATNGYHPLWMVILVGIYKVWGSGAVGDMLPIHIALGISIALNALTGLIVWRILTRFSSNQWLVAAGVFVWSLNPFMLFETINGLETSLSLFFFAAFFLLAVRLQEGRVPQNIVSALVLGTVGGLLVLARLDLAIYFAAWWVWFVLRDWKSNWVFAVQTGVVAALVASPWFLWNYSHFHMLFTSASRATDLVNHTLIYQDNGTSIVQTIKAVFYSLYNGGELILGRTGAPVLALILLGLGVAYAAGKRLRLPRLKELSVEYALLVGFIVLFLANVAVRWGGRPWYFMSLELFIAIGAVLGLQEFFRDISYKRMYAVGLIGLTLFFFAVSWSKELRGQYSNQTEMYVMAQWMNEHLHKDTVVGAFNAGVEGYFSNAKVVNLDGLVNYNAYEAMRIHKLYSYIRDSKIAYISDWPISLNYRYKSFLDNFDAQMALSVVHAEGSDINGRFAGGLTLYKLK